METKQATINDLNIVLNFAIKIARQHQAYNPIRFSKFDNHHKLIEAYLSDELISNKTIITLLMLNNIVVGYSLIKLYEENLEEMATKRAWLHDIYIDEPARGLGGGKILLDATKKGALALGTSKILLHVAKQNKYAKDFFTSYGFEETLSEMMIII